MFKIFGFQKGKLDIKLSEFNYSPGDTIEGTVEVELKKDVVSTELSITMIGEEIERSRRRTGGRSRSSTSRRVIYEFKQPLEGEKEYADGDTASYPFQIKIPEDILQEKDGALDNFGKVARALSGARRRVDWSLVVRLSVPGFDMKRRRQINIT